MLPVNTVWWSLWVSVTIYGAKHCPMWHKNVLCFPSDNEWGSLSYVEWSKSLSKRYASDRKTASCHKRGLIQHIGEWSSKKLKLISLIYYGIYIERNSPLSHRLLFVCIRFFTLSNTIAFLLILLSYILLFAGGYHQNLYQFQTSIFYYSINAI